MSDGDGDRQDESGAGVQGESDPLLVIDRNAKLRHPCEDEGDVIAESDPMVTICGKGSVVNNPSQ